MEKEFNLSEKRKSLPLKPKEFTTFPMWVYPEIDVKEFIKIICDFIENNDDGYVDFIKEKAGNKLDEADSYRFAGDRLV